MARGTAGRFRPRPGRLDRRPPETPAGAPARSSTAPSCRCSAQPHRIRHRADVRGTVWREGQEIHVAGRPEHLPRRLRDWLTAELRGRLVPLVHAKAARVERPVKRITVRDSALALGSCGPDATMSFSWRLVFAPPEVLDYLVAHEVAHLVHLNHGPRFWALARTLCDGPIEAPQSLAQEEWRGPAAIRRVASRKIDVLDAVDWIDCFANLRNPVRRSGSAREDWRARPMQQTGRHHGSAAPTASRRSALPAHIAAVDRQRTRRSRTPPHPGA